MTGSRPITTQKRKLLVGDELEDALILKMFAEAEEAFQNGDRKELLNVIFLCAKYQAVIPDWAADELLAIRKARGTGAPG